MYLGKNVQTISFPLLIPKPSPHPYENIYPAYPWLFLPSSVVGDPARGFSSSTPASKVLIGLALILAEKYIVFFHASYWFVQFSFC